MHERRSLSDRNATLQERGVRNVRVKCRMRVGDTQSSILRRRALHVVRERCLLSRWLGLFVGPLHCSAL